MIFLVVIVLISWMTLATFHRIAATTIGGLICAGVLVYAFGWPVLVFAALAAAFDLSRRPKTN